MSQAVFLSLSVQALLSDLVKSSCVVSYLSFIPIFFQISSNLVNIVRDKAKSLIIVSQSVITADSS